MTMTAHDWLVMSGVAGAQGDVPMLTYALQRALALDDSDPQIHQALITNLDMLPYAPDAAKRQARLAFDRRFVQPIMRSGAAVQSHGNDPDPDRVLRIGYVSADLFASSASYCHGSLILGSDHRQCEVYVYATTSPHAKPDDPVTPVFREQASVWRDVTDLDDHEVASLIVSDQIDVLVDLSGYSSGSRMLVFAYRPAPIQVTGWGHATGTDLSCFDYTVADAVTVPPEDEHQHREAILRVPSTIVYVPSGRHPIMRQPSARITFGYLGRAEKISPPCLAAWADLLHRAPGSRLLLKTGAWEDADRRARVLVPLGAYGIGSDRVEFRGETWTREHLLTYNEIDVHLDAFPHTGGVTTMDACWMGCPTVTLKGSTISGRISASILTTLGRQAWIAETPDQYVETAIGLARMAQPAEYREAAREQMRRSVLVDQHQYALAVEGGFRAAWRRWCAMQTSVRDCDSAERRSGQAVALSAV